MRFVKVNTLPVAERWQKKLQEERHPSARFRIGIWELPYQSNSEYTHTSATRYVVGSKASVEARVSHLGKRIDK